jgi:hypothetical protein
VRTISREVFVTPQRLYAEHSTRVMRQSEPYGDIGRTAEMTVPPLDVSGGNRVPKVAKFLVG